MKAIEKNSQGKTIRFHTKFKKKILYDKKLLKVKGKQTGENMCCK